MASLYIESTGIYKFKKGGKMGNGSTKINSLLDVSDVNKLIRSFETLRQDDKVNSVLGLLLLEAGNFHKNDELKKGGNVLLKTLKSKVFKEPVTRKQLYE